MGGATQAVFRGIVIKNAEGLRRSAALVSANADAYYIAVLVPHRQFEDLLRGFQAKMTHRVKDPQHGDAEVALAALASSLDTLEQRLELVLPPVDHPDRDIDLGMNYALA